MTCDTLRSWSVHAQTLLPSRFPRCTRFPPSQRRLAARRRLAATAAARARAAFPTAGPWASTTGADGIEVAVSRLAAGLTVVHHFHGLYATNLSPASSVAERYTSSVSRPGYSFGAYPSALSGFQQLYRARIPLRCGSISSQDGRPPTLFGVRSDEERHPGLLSRLEEVHWCGGQHVAVDRHRKFSDRQAAPVAGDLRRRGPAGRPTTLACFCSPNARPRSSAYASRTAASNGTIIAPALTNRARRRWLPKWARPSIALTDTKEFGGFPGDG